jgi:hypothetical protein
MINKIFYPFKAIYYYFVFVYHKEFGTYDQKLRAERLYHEVDYEATYGVPI